MPEYMEMHVGFEVSTAVAMKISIFFYKRQSWAGPWRAPHFLDNRLTDGSEVFNLTRRPPFTLQEDS
jgi:hypothetical protein